MPTQQRGESTTTDVLTAAVEPDQAAVGPGEPMLMVTMVGWPRPMVVEKAAIALLPIYRPPLSHSVMSTWPARGADEGVSVLWWWWGLEGMTDVRFGMRGRAITAFRINQYFPNPAPFYPVGGGRHRCRGAER